MGGVVFGLIRSVVQQTRTLIEFIGTIGFTYRAKVTSPHPGPSPQGGVEPLPDAQLELLSIAVRTRLP
jgi:hypothetical protein